MILMMSCTENVFMRLNEKCQMKETLLLIVCFSIAMISGCRRKPYESAREDNARHIRNIKFQIIRDVVEQELLRNQELNICRFVCFRLKPGAPSPYLNKKADWYITSVTTDDKGIFSLDLSQIDTMDIVVVPGEPYSNVRFSRSSDLSHTKSEDHIRVARFERDTNQLICNTIYDLNRKIVKIIPVSGQPEEQPYEDILLVTNREN